MKFLFPLSEWSLRQRPECWLQHLAVCLNSLRTNTELEPVVIWRGALDHPVAKFLASRIWLVASRNPFEDIMRAPEFKPQREIEVSFSTLLKLEAYLHCMDDRLIVGDVDCLWLRQPERINLTAALAAGPQMYRGDTRLNAGMTLIDAPKMRAANVIEHARQLIARTFTGSDEVVLNDCFPAGQWQLLPWEHRAFWPMATGLPAVVHFHGPKLEQIDAMNADTCEIGRKDAEIARLFLNARRQLSAWAEVARPYLNAPEPFYRQLLEACALR